MVLKSTKSNNRFLITTVIPLYNGENTLRKTIGSVISQTYFNQTELILIDDGSSDTSLDIANDFKQKYPDNIKIIINPKNLGIAKTQNIGLKNAQGKYVARLDQDDVWIDKKKLEKQATALEANPAVGLIGTWAKVVNEDGPDFELTPPITDEKIRAKLLMASMFVAPSIMLRKDLTKQIGFYKEDLQYGTEDFDYWLRIGKVAKLMNLSSYGLEYHFHPGSYSNQNKVKAMREHVSIIKNYKRDYPGYFKAFVKNYIQYQLLKITFLRKFYNYVVPRVAKIIYS